ncbi:MAG: cytochrome c biogenesis protein CcsA [Magnetococcales bacterium]|nr:cytochrome c biogenesis protein CcsA [Magnetococcales bacterium]
MDLSGIAFGWAVAVYVAAAFFVIWSHWKGNENSPPAAWWLTLSGWTALLLYLGGLVAVQGGLHANFRTSLEMVAFVVGVLLLAGWRWKQQETRAAGLLLLPVVALLLLASRLLTDPPAPHHPVMGPEVLLHLLLSLLAYGLFTIAAALALLDAFQERALRRKELGRLFSLLPPLSQIEERLFNVAGWGFVLLSFSIATGAVVSHQTLGTWFTLSHKVVFTWATWLVFGTLLWGRHRYGWRGRRAVRFTLFGYFFLMLGFLGVKFVTEVLLHRAG